MFTLLIDHGFLMITKKTKINISYSSYSAQTLIDTIIWTCVVQLKQQKKKTNIEIMIMVKVNIAKIEKIHTHTHTHCDFGRRNVCFYFFLYYIFFFYHHCVHVIIIIIIILIWPIQEDDVCMVIFIPTYFLLLMWGSFCMLCTFIQS